MSTATIIPLKIDSDAQQRIDDLGLQHQFDRMIEHTRQTIPDLLAIRVELGYDYEEGGDPMVVIHAHRPEPHTGEYDRTDQDWGAWFVSTFPGQVLAQFVMMSFYEPSQ